MFWAIQVIVSLVLCKKVSICTFYFNFVIFIEYELVGWKHMEGLHKKLAGQQHGGGCRKQYHWDAF
jgi:hypothetical protein